LRSSRCWLFQAFRRHKIESEKSDPVVLRFSTVGDSRQDPKEADATMKPLSAQDKIWLQNTKAWSRIMRDIEGQKSKLLFFNGDMIMGYGLAGATPSNSVADVAGSDLMAFYRQFGFWRGMVAPLMEAGTYIVPVPGNHEVQSKPMGKKAQPENEIVWRANMGDLIVDADRFQKPGVTGLDKSEQVRDGFWDVIERFGATYFCGHEHGFNMVQPRGAAWRSHPTPGD
jgi:hypothetical protein